MSYKKLLAFTMLAFSVSAFANSGNTARVFVNSQEVQQTTPNATYIGFDDYNTTYVTVAPNVPFSVTYLAVHGSTSCNIEMYNHYLPFVFPSNTPDAVFNNQPGSQSISNLVLGATTGASVEHRYFRVRCNVPADNFEFGIKT